MTSKEDPGSPFLPRQVIEERTAVVTNARTDFQRVLQERQSATAARYLQNESAVVATKFQERQAAAEKRYVHK